MARRGKDNDHTKSGQLRRRGQYRIQHDMMNDDDCTKQETQSKVGCGGENQAQKVNEKV